jgi:hypothetical protein
MNEKSFMGMVVELMRLSGFLVYHTYDSRRSEAGFPDLVAIRQQPSSLFARLLFVELKTDKGALSTAQIRWLQLLNLVPCVEVFVWRPSDFDEIKKVLRRRTA